MPSETEVEFCGTSAAEGDESGACKKGHIVASIDGHLNVGVGAFSGRGTGESALDGALTCPSTATSSSCVTRSASSNFAISCSCISSSSLKLTRLSTSQRDISNGSKNLPDVKSHQQWSAMGISEGTLSSDKFGIKESRASA